MGFRSKSQYPTQEHFKFKLPTVKCFILSKRGHSFAVAIFIVIIQFMLFSCTDETAMVHNIKDVDSFADSVAIFGIDTIVIDYDVSIKDIKTEVRRISNSKKRIP